MTWSGKGSGREVQCFRRRKDESEGMMWRHYDEAGGGGFDDLQGTVWYFGNSVFQHSSISARELRENNNHDE